MRSLLAQPVLRLIPIAAMAVAAACGSSGSVIGPLPDPDDPSDPGPNPSPGPVPAGYAIFAVDLSNQLIVFGSADPTVITRKKKISGMPILNRIVGIDFHPTTGVLYGVGNDSRVYVIDTLTAKATAVTSTKFSPAIASFFDIHFGMGFEPSSNKIRLIATESGGNWLIDPVTGTATTGNKPKYADGPHAGKTMKINGLAYRPPGASAAIAARMNAFAASITKACTELMYAINAEYAEIVGSCDPDEGDFTSLGPIPGVTAVAGCGELKFDHGPGNLWKVIQDGTTQLNRMGTVDPETGWVTWHGYVPDESPIQAMAFAPGGLYGPTPGPNVTTARVVPAAAVSDAAETAGSGLPSCTGS